MNERELVAERASQGELAWEELVADPVAWEPAARTLVVADRSVERTSGIATVAGVALLVLAVVLYLVADVGQLRDPIEVLVALATIGSATTLIVRGRRPGRVRNHGLAWVSQPLQQLRLRQFAEQTDLFESPPIPIEDVRQVLYSLRSVELPAARRGTRVEAAGVFVRLVDGSVWPVMSGTLQTESAYRIAQGLATRLGVTVKQVGRGWSNAPARTLH